MDNKLGNPPPYAPPQQAPGPGYQNFPQNAGGVPAYPPPPPVYASAPPQTYVTSPTINLSAQPVIPTQVIVVGGCPSCRIGVLEDDYTCCGILCAILFFPIGILCCLAMKQRRCPNCGAIFG